MAAPSIQLRLQRPVDPERDHVRGDPDARDGISVLIYGDYLCPYCRRLRGVLERLRKAIGSRMTYVFRHFSNEHAHPRAEFPPRPAEAAGWQNRFWEMHDALYNRDPPLTRDHVLDAAREVGLDMDRLD